VIDEQSRQVKDGGKPADHGDQVERFDPEQVVQGELHHDVANLRSVVSGGIGSQSVDYTDFLPLFRQPALIAKESRE
jgi:hypothetical protein